MAENEFGISAKAKEIIGDQGYAPSYAMDAHIAKWRAMYTATDEDFYKVPYVTSQGKKRHRERASIRPARKVCREMASLILTEDTEVSVDAPRANKWLQDYLDRSNFWPTGYDVVEDAFALGTSAWTLRIDVQEETRILLPRHDARMIVPLEWSADGVTACAFVSRVMARRKAYEQLQIMDEDDGTYHIRTWLLDEGKAVDAEALGVLPDFDTESTFKPFGIFTPGISNIYEDLSPFGPSLFADAIDEIKAVDTAWDAIVQEVALTGVKVFLDEELLEVQADAEGNVVPVGAMEDMVYRKLAGKEMRNYIEVFSPNIRTDPLVTALNTALAQLGDTCGFGQNYFQIDKPGGLKTAKEVVSDSSQLMRSVRKHENVIRGAIQDVVGALLDNARIHCGADIEEDFGPVSVSFDDSVIADTESEKALMLSEIAAGVVPKWMYLVKFYGMSEEEARREVGTEVADKGY